MRLRMRLSGAVLAASALLPLATAALAVDTPTETGCPTSYQLLKVADLALLGYMVPTFVDEVIGNSNGLVCGMPVSDRVQEKFCESIGGCTVDTIYYFRDDDIPALKG